MTLTEDELRLLLEDHEGCPICGEEEEAHPPDCLCSDCFETFKAGKEDH
jgi:hypothetical protein